jgi:hypothetical protein
MSLVEHIQKLSSIHSRMADPAIICRLLSEFHLLSLETQAHGNTNLRSTVTEAHMLAYSKTI